jgi:hypothetical protein
VLKKEGTKNKLIMLADTARAVAWHPPSSHNQNICLAIGFSTIFRSLIKGM